LIQKQHSAFDDIGMVFEKALQREWDFNLPKILSGSSSGK